MEHKDQGNQGKETLKSLFSEGLQIGREVSRKGIERSNELVSESAERAGMSEQLDSVRQGLQRSGEVITGADLREFDDFTDAVTRVAVGLHRDQADMDSRLARLEQSIGEIRQLQDELSERLAIVEQLVAGQNGTDSAGHK